MGGSQRTCEAWVRVGLAAAGLAGALALAVTASRLPWAAGWLPAESFYKLLVAHVTFSLVAWLLSCAVAVTLHTCSAKTPDHAPALAAAGILGMLAGLAFPGRPVVVDYLPYVDSPVYVVGLLLFAGAAGGSLTRCVRHAQPGPARWAAGCVAASYWFASLALAVGLLRVGPGSPQAAVWGAGHALQFVYVSSMALSWSLLAGKPGSWPLHSAAYFLSATFSLLPALPYLTPHPDHFPRWESINALLGVSLSIPVGLHFLALRGTGWGHDAVARAALRWSMGLYVVGGVLAPIGAAHTLRVTAHYHAMLVGGVTMAFMGAVYRILQAQGRPYPRGAPLGLHLFGSGVLATVGALVLAAGFGLPRKAYLTGAHPWDVPLVLLAAAGILSAAGGAWFLVCTWRALHTPQPQKLSARLGAPAPVHGPLG